MNIYWEIKKAAEKLQKKQVMSMTSDLGEHTTYTYEEMFVSVDIFAEKLEEIGIVAGDRIVIVAENSPQWNIAYLSIMKSNCTSVLVDFSLPKEEILRLIGNADPRCVFASPKTMDKLGEIPPFAFPVLNIMEKAQAFFSHPLVVTQTKTADGDPEIAFIIYSSGTTKTATGIMHTHEAMIGTTKAAIAFNHLTHEDKMLVVIPNSHIYGVVTSMIGPLMLGASMHFIESMTGEQVLKAFAQYQPTVFSCVPRVFEMFEKQIIAKINSKQATKMMFAAFFPLCFALRKATGMNLGKLIFKSIHNGFGGNIRIFCAAGAPISEQTTKFYYGVGLNLFLNYGLTETNVPVVANNYENYTFTSCGKAYPHVEVKLVPIDENGNSELYLKTPYMMKGYFRDEEATKAAFVDGWFQTGDLATMDEQGNFLVVGRCKDNIVLPTGKKVTPDDVEEKYGLQEGVLEFVVCGVASKAGGYDEIHGFVVADKVSRLTKEEIIETIYEKGSTLSQYMKLSAVHFVESIPKTSLQKPKRYLLKQTVLEGEKPVMIKEEETPQDVKALLISIIAQIHKTDAPIEGKTRLFEDIGFDSLNCIELDLQLEEKLSKNIASRLKPNITIEEMVVLLNGREAEKKNTFGEKFPREKRMFDYVMFKCYSLLARGVYKIKVTGIENLPQNNGYILCANHETNFDFLWITSKFQKYQFQKLGCMAKKELFNSSLASKTLSRVCGMIPIDRENHNGQGMNLCKEKLKEGWNLLIYPEGTRTTDGKMGEFKKGAAMLAKTENVPIVPVKIKGGFEIYPSKRKLPKLFDFKRMKRCEVEVCFSPPVYGEELDVEALNDKVKEIVMAM